MTGVGALAAMPTRIDFLNGHCNRPELDDRPAEQREQVAFVDLWFPDGYSGPYQAQADDARAWCLGQRGRPVCPMLAACQVWAEHTRPGFGIWAGVWIDNGDETRRRSGARPRRRPE